MARGQNTQNEGIFPVGMRTQVTLNAGETWTSEAFDATDYASAHWFIFTDVDSAANGAYIETSLDGTNFSSVTSLTHTITGGTALFRILTAASKYYRINYTNGSSNQGTFTCYMKFDKRASQKLSSTRDQTINVNSDVELYRVTNDYLLDIARGNVGDFAKFRKFGANEAVGTSEEIIWPNSGAFAGLLSSASAVQVRAGGDAGDTVASTTGARKIVVEGLDENWAEASEEIDLAGTSASTATTTTFIRVFRAYVSESGLYTTSGLTGANIAAIDVETTGGTLMIEIGAGRGQSEHAQYTVPANKTLILNKVHADVSGGKPATIRFYKRLNADDVTLPVEPPRIFAEFEELDGDGNEDFGWTEQFPAKTDIIVTGQAASATAKVNASYTGILVDS